MLEVTMEDIQRLVGLQLGKRKIEAHDRFMEDLAAESADVANIVGSPKQSPRDWRLEIGD